MLLQSAKGPPEDMRLICIYLKKSCLFQVGDSWSLRLVPRVVTAEVGCVKVRDSNCVDTLCRMVPASHATTP